MVADGFPCIPEGNPSCLVMQQGPLGHVTVKAIIMYSNPLKAVASLVALGLLDLLYLQQQRSKQCMYWTCYKFENILKA